MKTKCTCFLFLKTSRKFYPRSNNPELKPMSLSPKSSPFYSALKLCLDLPHPLTLVRHAAPPDGFFITIPVPFRFPTGQTLHCPMNSTLPPLLDFTRLNIEPTLWHPLPPFLFLFPIFNRTAPSWKIGDTFIFRLLLHRSPLQYPGSFFLPPN